MTKAHSMGEKSATLHESFLNHQIKHTTFVLKYKPFICSDYHLCFSGLGDHLANDHQIKRGSDEFLQENLYNVSRKIFLKIMTKKQNQIT